MVCVTFLLTQQALMSGSLGAMTPLGEVLCPGGIVRVRTGRDGMLDPCLLLATMLTSYMVNGTKFMTVVDVSDPGI